MNVNTSGITSLSELDTSEQVIDKLLDNALFGGNLGLGVDLGATYEIDEKMDCKCQYTRFRCYFS